VVVNVDVVPTIRFIFNARKRGDSLRDIATKLNARGVFGPRGDVWHHTSVNDVLANRDAYMGKARGLSEVRWPAVLKAS
jgi:hypothetical protein